MRRISSLMMAALFLSVMAGCASDNSKDHKDSDDWQQYRSQKGQEELSKEVQGNTP
ncbi:MAG: hypothetical protein KKF58_02655 [Gammaproteobacteria bacterium]|nr:hypothetical protein [Gammaproteobacteria bacterium]MBU1447190.1 hypothetical protein [Gammaproteobacteria bacterium]MDD2928780.1 hypothetical protein [Sideroxydans sp.]MDD5471008.1 hypothetical protein [Sideroxydans sp.]